MTFIKALLLIIVGWLVSFRPKPSGTRMDLCDLLNEEKTLNDPGDDERQFQRENA